MIYSVHNKHVFINIFVIFRYNILYKITISPMNYPIGLEVKSMY